MTDDDAVRTETAENGEEYFVFEASDALIEASKHKTLEEVHTKLLKARRGDCEMAKEIRSILEKSRTLPLGSKAVPRRPVLKRRRQKKHTSSVHATKRVQQEGRGFTKAIDKKRSVFKDVARFNSSFEPTAKHSTLRSRRTDAPRVVINRQRILRFPQGARGFVDGIDPAGLIKFRMPETVSAEFRGMDPILAFESTYIYGRSWLKYDTLAEA